MAEYQITSFTAESQIEGPQILLQWALPTDVGSTSFRILRKDKNFSEDENDGTLILADAVSSGIVSYVDLNPDTAVALCYSAFVYHTATTVWTANTLIEANTTIIPATPPLGYFYVSNTRGFTGALEPTDWPTVIGSTVQDGDITWTCGGTNPAWVTSNRSRKSAFTWDSEYMQRLLFSVMPPPYRDEDQYSNQVRLSPQQDSDENNVWRAVHEDGITARGEFERFLLIFSSYLSRVRGAADFYPSLVDPDRTLVEYLPFLAGNVGWNLNTAVHTGAQRQAILSAVPMYKIKGTISGLGPQLRQALGVLDIVVDPMSKHILFSNSATRQTAKGGTINTYSAWATGAHARGDIVIPSSGNETGYYYQARAGGTTAGPEPTWPTSPGDDVADGVDVIWRAVQFGVPHLTADVVVHAIDSFAAASMITLDASEGDVSSYYPPGRVFNVAGSTDEANDGTYTVSSAPSATPTIITTVETTITSQAASSARAGPSSLSIDDTSIFTAGATINIRDSVGPDGEEIAILGIPNSTTLTLDGTPMSGYAVQDSAVTSPAFDWHDDETGFIWDIPGEESFAGIDPDRIRIRPAIVTPSELYSFAVLRFWARVAVGESISTAELAQVDKIAEQFTPSDTKIVVRIESR